MPLLATALWLCQICGNIMLLILGKRATSAHGTSTGLDEDSCEDFLQQEEEECDDDYDDDSDDDSYKGKRNIGTSDMALPVQRNTEDLFGYVSVQ
jgi:hypothetical protein